ncbi:DUF4625 domain-containing protein [Parapedobacter sp. SGR-10]|uniref:DUF4625 domain-containing protein n=1 Tax=Parapedobacter sp. SGR-10 TaxID=2710879 RepID=UPI0013D02059|nr:DUF4625 domain-containing protein [Parapedobacter sp. SGR-10]NGF57966.1 DUF4625 domain-containing protein [Parapedobacter sp. SGR-10]
MRTLKHNKFIVALTLLAATLFSLSSCEKDKDPVLKAPVIDLSEVGSGNSKQATIGGDLHLEGTITAEALIQRIDIEIHQEGGGSFEIEKSYTEGKYIGVRQVEFHEHLDIPANAPAGEYHLHFTVTDKNGQTTTVESELELVIGSPSAALVFTLITGESVEGHGDHFHGLDGAVEGASTTVTFDANGNALSGGHLHLDPEAIYKISLKTYDAQGNETQDQRFIANEATASLYKAFLIGGGFILNPDSPEGEGALFQTRETQYADGTAVSGATNTTGVTTYFTVGHDNEGEKDVTFVMRKLNAGVKANITRTDWNRTDYTTAFAGSNELELKFEIHAEHDH